MKRIVLSVLLMSIFALSLSACNDKPDVNKDVLPVDNNTMTTCSESIEAYLDSANSKWKWDAIKTGDTIVVNYIGRLSMDDVFDTNVESVAKACGVYNPQRNYNEGLSFKVGAWQMIPWFDEWVVGMKLGQTKTLKFPASKGYGERNEKAIVKVEKSNLPEEASQYKVGTEVMTQMGQKFKVKEVTDTYVVFDANHELAGKALTFDVTISEIK